MTKAKWRRVRLALASALFIVLTCSAFLLASARPAKAALTDLGYPWAAALTVPGGTYDWGYTTCPTSAPKCMNMKVYGTDGKTYGESDPYGYVFRNCTSFVAWKLVSLGVDPSHVEGLGNGGQWYDKAANKSGLTRGTTPKVGAAAVIPATYDSNGNLKTFGHVAYVDKVNYDSSGNPISFEVQQSNSDFMGDQDQSTYRVQGSSFTEFVYFGPLMTNPPSNPSPTPTPVPWHFENLEGGQNAVSPYQGNVGRTPASVVFNGQLYVYYYSVTGHNLRVAYTTPGWVFDTVDGLGGGSGKISADVGQVPSAIVFNNAMYVFYYDNTNGNLRMAWSSDGRTWQAETLDGDPGSLSGYNANVGQTPFAVVYNNSLQVFYYQPDQGVLRHAWSGNGSSWSFETLDGNSGSISHFSGNVGFDPSAVVYNGSLQLFYYNQSQGDLRHAWADANGWHFENLDGDAGSVGHIGANVGGSPTAFVFQSNLGVFYYDKDHHSLRHAWSDASGWHFETLAGGSNSTLGDTTDIGTTSTAVLDGTTLQVFVYQAGGGNLIHIWNDGTWHEENLDGAGGSPSSRVDANVGLDPVAIMFGSTLDVFYYDTDHGALRHAWPN